MTAELPLIEVRDLVKRLGGTAVLKGVSFAVARGSVTAIIGASGSGKSTLLRLLNLLILPDDGEILWDGRPVGFGERGGRRVPEPERVLLKHRCQIGMVFQGYNLFPNLTALQNIIEAPIVVLKRDRREATEDAVALLDKVRLRHRAHAYPHQLSGGEQQRVAIARALAMRPRAMLFDEVTSALDPELKGEVLGTMRDLAAEGMTMVVVSHELSFVRQVAHQVLFMTGGRIAERGPPEELMSRPQLPELRSFLRSVLD
jgi:ABC-type polar amino acid transport system ATPase subunit